MVRTDRASAAALPCLYTTPETVCLVRAHVRTQLLHIWQVRAAFAATRGGPEDGCGEAAPAIPLPYFPAFTSSSAISRSLNFCTFMDGVMGKSSTKNTRLGTL